MGILGLGRKKQVVEEVAPEPVVKQRSGPALMLLVPEVAGGTSFRAFPFVDAEDAIEYLRTMIPAAVPRVHAFWAMMEKPREASAGGEAMVLIRSDTEDELAYVVSFVDIESALSFARFEVKRGMNLAMLRVYWAEMVSIEIDETGIHLTPESAPRSDAPRLSQPVPEVSSAAVEAAQQLIDPIDAPIAPESIETPPAQAQVPEREGGATTNLVPDTPANAKHAADVSHQQPPAPVEPDEQPFSLNPELAATNPEPEVAPAPSAEPNEDPQPTALQQLDEPAPSPERDVPVEVALEPDESAPGLAGLQIDEPEPIAAEAPEPETAVEIALEPDESAPGLAGLQIDEPEPIAAEAPEPETAVEIALEPDESAPGLAGLQIDEPEPIAAEAPEPETAVEIALEPDESAPGLAGLQIDEPEPIAAEAPEPETAVEIALEPDESAPGLAGLQIDEPEPIAAEAPEPETAVEIALEPDESAPGLAGLQIDEPEPIAAEAPEPEIAIDVALEPDELAPGLAGQQIEEPELIVAEEPEAPQFSLDPQVTNDLVPEPEEELETIAFAEAEDLPAIDGMIAPEDDAADPEAIASDEAAVTETSPLADAEGLSPDPETLEVEPEPITAESVADEHDTEEPSPDAEEESTLTIELEMAEVAEVEVAEPEVLEAIAEETPPVELAFEDKPPVADAPAFLREGGRNEAATEWPDEPLSPQSQYEIDPEEVDQQSDTPDEDSAAAEFEVTLGEVGTEPEPGLVTLDERLDEEAWQMPEMSVEEAVAVSANGASTNGFHDTSSDEDPPETIPGEEDLSPEMAAFLKSRRRNTKDNPFKGFESPPGRF